jgi:hypothetical protein
MEAHMTIANLHVLHQPVLGRGSILMEDVDTLRQPIDIIAEQIIIKQEFLMIYIPHPQMSLK